MSTERAAAVAAASILLAGCGSADRASSSTVSGEPSSSVAASKPTPTASEAQIESLLEGTWRAGPVSVRETVATLRRHGLDRWIEEYRPNSPLVGDTVLSLTIEGGAWDLLGRSGGGQPQPIDYDAEYEIDGDSVAFHHSDGSNTYRWDVDRDTLRLHFVRSTMPGYRGIPEEVFQRALYMTESFSRQE